MRFKRTKIVATIGPSSSEPAVLAELVRAGMNVARLNFSHGSHEDHAGYLTAVRRAAKELDTPVAVFQDLSGPKIRIGDFAEKTVTLLPGARLVLTPESCLGSAERVTIGYPHLAEEVTKGDRILLDDGRRVLEVTGTKGRDVVTRVVIGGTIAGRRGVNIPGALRRVSAITKKDRADLAFGLAQGVDLVGLSFVRSSEDVKKLRALIRKRAPKNPPLIIAKIETVEAIEQIDAIIAEADAIMVARGDLAVEVSPENVPLLQKRIIRKCVEAGKPVITATQMLESMIQNPVPTRAEVADVANAILDGTDAVMLSQETAMGSYPLEAVTMMAQIAHKTENHEIYRTLMRSLRESRGTDIVDAVGRAVADAASSTEAKAIVALSKSGFTARMIARYRPARPIIVFTSQEETARQLTLSFACHPLIAKHYDDLLQVVAESKAAILRQKLAQKDDRIVLAAGVPFGKEGGTNLMMVQTL